MLSAVLQVLSLIGLCRYCDLGGWSNENGVITLDSAVFMGYGLFVTKWRFKLVTRSVKKCEHWAHLVLCSLQRMLKYCKNYNHRFFLFNI